MIKDSQELCKLLSNLPDDLRVLEEFFGTLRDDDVEAFQQAIQLLEPFHEKGNPDFFADFDNTTMPSVNAIIAANADDRCKAVFDIGLLMRGYTPKGFADWHRGSGWSMRVYSLLCGLVVGDPSEKVRAAALLALAEFPSEGFPSGPEHRKKAMKVMETITGNGLDAIVAKAVEIFTHMGPFT